MNGNNALSSSYWSTFPVGFVKSQFGVACYKFSCFD